MSPGQLLWNLQRYRRRQLDREERALLIQAAATHGGKAFETMRRQLQRETRALDGVVSGTAEEPPQCETPLSAEDFARMMREANEHGS